MRRRITVIIALISCLGCLSEKNADPGVPQTFVKYFNGGFDDVATDIKQTSDGGYILLGTSEIKESEVTASRFKIKVIKTDRFGSVIWQHVYPEFDSPLDSVSFKGRSIVALRDESGSESGYIIVGDSIQVGSISNSRIRVMITDTEGNIIKAKNIGTSTGVQGQAVAVNGTGNFVILGSSVNSQATNNMFLAELDQSLLPIWTRSYGAGTTNLSNKLFIDNQSSIYWSGTVTKNNRSDIRFVKTPPNSENTDFDLPIGKPEFDEQGNDITMYGFGFAVIGSTDEAGDDDILFKRLAQDGTELATKTYGFPNQSENGLGINQTKDGGLILLGSVDTNVEVGRGGKDFFLIKINAFGDTEWTEIFGSKNDDIGAGVVTNSDGSYTLLGTTVFGGLRTMTLIRTDKRGKVE